MKYITIILAILSFNCFGDELENIIAKAGLHEVKISKDKDWSAENNSDFEYSVVNKSEKIDIFERKTEYKKENVTITINGFKYVGDNHGEWGGSLRVKYPNGQEEILIKDNVVQLIPHNNELYVFTGLDHMGLSRGALYKIIVQKGKPHVEMLSLLPTPRVVVTEERGHDGSISFIIVTSDGLVDLWPNDQIFSVLAANQFWSGLYPSSAVLHENHLIIGMRSGVVVIDLDFLHIVGGPRYYTK